MGKAIIFPNLLTSHFPQEEALGIPMQDDLPAAKHYNSITGGTPTGTSVIYDGAGNKTDSKTKANGIFIDITGSVTMYMDLIAITAIGPVQEFWIRPKVFNATRQGPNIAPLFNGTLGRMNFAAHQAAGSAVVDLQMGRDFNEAERCLAILSYDFPAKVINALLYSKDGLRLSGSSVPGTADPGFGATDFYTQFDSTSGVFSNVELVDQGGGNVAVTLEEMVSEAERWLTLEDKKASRALLLLEDDN